MTVVENRGGRPRQRARVAMLAAAADFSSLSLRDPRITELTARVGARLGFSVGADLAVVPEQMPERAEAITAAGHFVDELVTLFRRAFDGGLESALTTALGGVVMVKILTADDAAVEMEMRRRAR